MPELGTNQITSFCEGAINVHLNFSFEPLTSRTGAINVQQESVYALLFSPTIAQESITEVVGFLI